VTKSAAVQLTVGMSLFYRGTKCDTIHKYSDRLLALLAKAHCPEFRDHVQMQHVADMQFLEFVDVDMEHANTGTQLTEV
jgi:hypothetical protein